MTKIARVIRASPRQWLFGIVLVTNLFVYAVIGVSLFSSHALYGERAAIASRNTNSLVSQSIAGEIDRIDLALQVVADEFQRQLASGSVEAGTFTQFLRTQRGRLPMLEALRVADSLGNVRFSDEAGLPSGITVADRDYFTASRDGRAGTLAISQPLTGRISGKWLVIFARPLTAPNGRFAGLVFAPVAISWFEQKFANLEVGPRGAVVLRGDASRDFDLLARVPQAGYVGQTKVSDKFRATIMAAPDGGTYQAFAGADNIQRTFSYQKVGHYPLITLVGLATEDIFAQWWREVYKLSALGTLFTLVTLIGGYAVYRAWLDRSRAYEQFRLLLTSAGVGIFGVDVKGACTFCNPAALCLLGFQRENDLLGKDIGRLICPTYCQSHELVSNADVHTDAEEFAHTTGDTFPVEFWSHPQYRDGRLVGTVVTFADISERKNAENALKQLNENLELRIAEEVAKNREKDHLLIQQSRLVAMGEMMHNIAHQWRQPLNTVNLVLHNIKDAYEFGDLNESSLNGLISDGSKVIHRMSSIIDDFRNFFRPDKEKAVFRVNDAIQSTLNLIQASLEAHHINVSVNAESEVLAEGYPNEFEQVLLNVLSNAQDAIKARVCKGMVTIAVDQTALMAQVRIHNNGGRIPEQLLPKIFDPYFTTKDSGSGIGLYLSRMIIEHMQGQISAQNTEDGVEFVITVPRAPTGTA